MTRPAAAQPPGSAGEASPSVLPISAPGATPGAVPGAAPDVNKQTGARRPAWLPVPPARWMGWRLRLLTALALAVCLVLFLLARSLGQTPHLDARWSVNAQGALVLQASRLPALAPHLGRTLLALQGADGRSLTADPLWLQRGGRWQSDEWLRQRQLAQQLVLADLVAQPALTLHFIDGTQVTLTPPPRGWAGLGWAFWPLAGLALWLAMLGAVVMLSAPRQRNLLYLLMCLSQAASLVFIAISQVRGLGLPAGWLHADLPWRSAFDVVTAAAVLHALALRPAGAAAAPGAHLPGPLLTRASVALAWAAAALWAGALFSGALAAPWWWTQGLVLGLGTGALLLASLHCRVDPNPRMRLLRRYAAAGVATAVLLSAAVAGANALAARAQAVSRPDELAWPVAWLGVAAEAGTAAATLWTLLVAALLLLVPFLARSRQLLREFALLAGIGTVAASLDLLFVALFALGPFASFGLAVLIAVALYAGARQWLMQRMMGYSVITTERTFEQLYRAARELQAHPEQHAQVLATLLREMFEPMALERAGAGPDAPPDRPETPMGSRVLEGGAVLEVPVRTADDGPAGGSRRHTPRLRLRYAQHGQRLFNPEDARLADRVVEQLRRAAAYDRAVERGRSEERARIAQDLHDDIGARLLTLMYRAPTPEMEDYIRHTLKDLKTLTRGLARSEHRLGEAAAEWKADLTQRTAAAHVRLGWSFSADRELALSMVQWQALTRMLRELCTNVLAHGQANRLDVRMSLRGRSLALRVADDGIGRAPETWAHGLGLGGVRKRVKQLGGSVAWRENTPQGIVCEVLLPAFAAETSAADSPAETADAPRSPASPVPGPASAAPGKR